MGEPKPLASLSSSLLARKGQARPAMRPQGFANFAERMANGQDDLGWNDMGHEAPRGFEVHREEPLPAVVHQQAALAEEYAAHDLMLPHPLTGFAASEAPATPAAREIHPVPALPLPLLPLPTIAIARVKQAAKGRTTKAAFTLRLDPDRHLRLRLACAIGRVSAQAMVTRALDQYLGGQPEIDALARETPAASRLGRQGQEP